MDKRNSTFYLTFLSVISSFAVVMLHTNGCFWRYSTDRYWFTANIIEGILYFAVPVFLMITGVNLLDYRDKYSTKEFFKKRINKVFIPFIFWSLLCVIVNARLTGALSLATFNPLSLFDNIINVRSNDYYWYFPALFGVYMSFPVLSMIPKDKKIEVFKYIVLMTIIFNYVLPSIFQYILNIKYGDSYLFHVGSRYIGYACTGYLLNNMKITKKDKTIIYGLGILSLIITIIMTYTLSKEAGTVIKDFIKYESITQYFYAVMIFIMSKDLCNIFTHNKFRWFIANIGQYTFSIYLLHWFFIKLFIVVVGINDTSILYRIGGGILIYILCIIFTYLLRKIPVFKRFLP